MKTQRAIALTALGLLVSVVAIAKPQGASRIGTNPEAQAGCPKPTLAQCMDGDYLERDRCGILQNKNQWTCSQLLKTEMEKKKAEKGEEYSTVPKTPDDKEGVGKVIRDTSISGPAKYTPDLYSYTSQQAARDYGAGSDVLGVNKYDLFTQNKNAIESCEEYAFEKFYDIAEFSRRVGDRRDHLKTLEVAFGPGSDPASIGTRHLADARLRGRDKRVFGSMMEGNRPRNLFFGIPANPAVKGQLPVPAAPNLVISLSKSGAQPLLAKTYQNAYIPNTWSAHKQLMQHLLFVPNPNFGSTLSLAPVEPDPSEQIKSAFGTIPGPPVKDQKRKRLAKELNELYNLQLRFAQGIDEWARLNVRYANSGWSPNVLDNQVYGGSDPPKGLDALSAGELNPPAPSNKIGVPKKPGPKAGLNTDLAIENPETVQRRTVLAGLVDIMEKADEEGCFDAGPNTYTACDWSPKMFANAVRNTYADEQDAAFEWCMEFTKGSPKNAQNVDEVFVDDPNYEQFHCSIKTGPTITSAELDSLNDQWQVCKKKRADYHAKKAADEAAAAHAKEIAEAKARVEKINDLVDDDGGGFKRPYRHKTRDEQMGGDKFNMGYSYDFGFGFEAKNEICKFELDTKGEFKTYATVFGKRFDIIDALAKFSTKERVVQAHARFGGKNLFTPVDEDWSKEEQSWDWSFAKTVGSGKKNVPIISTRFTIVVIPVKVEAGLSGEAGLSVGLEAEANGFNNEQCPSARISGVAEPFAGVDGYLEAGIDIFVAAIGIRGELTIIRAGLPFRVGVGVEVLKKDLPLTDPRRLGMFADTRLDLRVSTLNGTLSVYGKVGWCPFCIRGEKEIASWEGPSWDTNIFKSKYDVNLYDLGVALGNIK